MGCIYEVIGLACIVAVLLSLSNKAPYQLKMAIFFLGNAIIVLLCMPFMILRPRDYRNGLAPAWACRQLCKCIGVTMEVTGLENVQKEHGAVVVINHQSSLDLLVLAYLWPVIGRATVVAKKEILYFPFFGVGAWLWGTLYINRSRKTDSINSLKKESKAINKDNCKLLLFPEGTRNTTDTLLPFKKGSFHIAIESQCPVQPVVISKYWFLDTKNKIFRQGHATINILPEIPVSDDLDALMDKTRNIMQTEFTRVSQETKALNLKTQN